ncbi:MAG: UvrD-helicase domain-containing protein, partial [Firmicutes bacterium]|nr:UvrD-helicase domain-containing protein [Bacillota bacterium]
IAGGANANSANGADVNGAVAARPSPVALELRQRYAEVLVDEYQDINAVQETILSLLTGGDAGPSLFMVGDVKQSIYRFRLAEPGLFLAKYNLFSTSSGAGRLVNLARNFRSRRQVVEGVNYVFRLLMTRTVGEMEYDRRAELAYGAGYASLPEESDAVVELLLLDNTPDQAAAGREEAADGAAEQQMEQQMEQQADEPAEESADELGEEAEEELDSLQREARAVARRIIELVESGHPVSDRTGGCRPVTYRDVAVLMRAVAGRANIFMEEFRRLGVPAYAELSTGYFEATEVETMLALLKVIDNPRQDVPLAAVLTSAAGGFSADDLARIRVAGGSGDFYDALAKTAQSGDELLARRVASFLRRLDGWRTAARQKALPELIWALYRESGYYDYVGGLPGGSQRQANLRALYQRAGQFESTAYRGLFRFLRFIERLRRSEGDMGTARALGESENVVRIMSIHKSKGLEFPVVLVAGLGKKFNLANLNRNVLLHRDMGLGLQLVDPVRRLSYPTVAKLAVREKMRFEALAEEMRLLYVAMTRAKEKLILVGSVAKLKEAAVRWCAALEAEGARLPDWLTARAANYLDWLGPALARHQDGEPLRELAGLENSGRCPAGLSGAGTAESRWLVRLSGGGFSPVLTAGLEEEYRRAVFKMQPVQLSGPRRQEVEDRLSWVYPQQRSHLLAARTTITALQRLAHAGEEKENPREVFRAAGAMRPAFIQRRAGLSQADRGTALHLVMQLLNLSGDLSAAGVQSQMALMMEREQLLPEQGAAVDPEAVAGFFRSPLGRRVLAGRLVYREQPFTLALPLEEVYPHNGEADSGTGGADGAADTVLVQGIIDCLVEEAGGLLVVDYKTDYCTPETIPRLVERYRYQITLYSRAAETLTGRPVTGRYLYLFYLGEYVEVEIV